MIRHRAARLGLRGRVEEVPHHLPLLVELHVVEDQRDVVLQVGTEADHLVRKLNRCIE